MTTSLHEIHCRYVNGFSFTSVIVLKLSLAKRNLRGKVIHCYEMKKGSAGAPKENDGNSTSGSL